MKFASPTSLPELVMQDISEKIITNHLKPGQRINEARIAEEFGISRSPVREAIRILEKNRLVEIVPRKGARVTPISEETIEWFYDIFDVLYGLVSRKLVEKAAREDLDHLAEALTRIEAAAEAEDVPAYFDSIFNYAAVAMAAAHNPLLEEIIRELWPSNKRIVHASFIHRTDDLKNNVRFFQQATQYARERNAVAVEQVIHAFVRNERDFALKIARRDSNPEPARPLTTGS